MAGPGIAIAAGVAASGLALSRCRGHRSHFLDNASFRPTDSRVPPAKRIGENGPPRHYEPYGSSYDAGHQKEASRDERGTRLSAFDLNVRAHILVAHRFGRSLFLLKIIDDSEKRRDADDGLGRAKRSQAVEALLEETCNAEMRSISVCAARRMGSVT